MFTKTASAGFAASLMFSSFASPVLAETLQVGDKSFEIIDMPIVINRNTTDDNDEKLMKIQSNGRYQLIKILPALTQEKTVASAPAARSLYRLAEVQDLKTGKKLKVALPVTFNPPIVPIRL